MALRWPGRKPVLENPSNPKSAHPFQKNAAGAPQLPLRPEPMMAGAPPAPDDFSMPTCCMYGFAGEQAQRLQAPLGWAYPTILTLYAGMGVNATFAGSEPLPPRLFTAVMGDKGDGKSRTITRARALIHSDHEYLRVANINSDRALDKLFPGDDHGGNLPVPSWVVIQDELRILLEKMCIQGSTLASSLCSLFYEERTANADRSGTHSVAVRLSMLGALKVKDPDEFREIWRASTVHGLYDRYVLCPGPRDWQWDPHWRLPADNEGDVGNPGPKPLSTTVVVEPLAFRCLDDWARAGAGRGRLAEIGKRVASISAAVSNDREITPACAQAALAFATWQERVRAVYCPTEAQNPEAVVTGMIMDSFTHLHDRCPGEWVRFRSLMIERNWCRKWGSSLVTRVKNSLVGSGFLEEEMGKDARGNFVRIRHPRYRLSTEA
jgi:hypothetical protein